MTDNSSHTFSLGVHPIIYTLSAFFLFFVLAKILSFLTDGRARVLNPSKTHTWRSSQTLYGAYFCGVCQILVSASDGLFCGACGVFSHQKCSRVANKNLQCKAVTAPPPMKHHWVNGNIQGDTVCDVCDEDCEGGHEKDVRCCWCWRTVHSKCRPNIAEVCDYGRFKSLIIPPTSVHVLHLKNRLRRRLIVKSVTPPPWKDWSPLIVVANSKSGGSDAEIAAALFAGHLNPGQVVTLGSSKVEAALEWCRLLKDVRCRVLVAGGDGTVASILNTIHAMKLANPPAVAVLPFGTGNDLSRVLGWGAGTEAADIDPAAVLDSVLDADVVAVDRWSVMVRAVRSIPLTPTAKEMFMYNYAGFGVDAQVAYNFHKTRQSPFYLFNSRIFNKMLYVCFGTGECIEKTYKNLQDVLEVFLDGVRVELPSIEGIVILNIDSFGAGMHLWEMGQEEDPTGPTHSISDKKLEVVAFYSSFHMGGLQMGVGTPYRVGQAKTVKVVLHREMAVQVDGEPWNQQPAEFVFKHINQATMLRKVATPR